MASPKMLSPWLISLSELRDDEPVIVLLPHAGAGASSYFRFAQQITTARPLIVQLPGRENRMNAPLMTDLRACAGTILAELNRCLAGHREVLLFGHSLGALMAYEVARRYCEAAQASFTLRHVFLSGRGAPHAQGRLSAIHDLPDAQFWEEVRSLGGMPDALLSSPELKQLVAPILRADLQMNHDYAFAGEAPLPLPFTVLYGKQDHCAPQADVARWQDLTTAGYASHGFDGDHFFLFSRQSDVIQVLGATHALAV
ncbi:alpha/beta fold hydrolase [Duganella sp. FT92W]|uniref:Alpha/beta fold hydrolase n=1 Tax=Pseudoduganella rivuli TaxID=2666085 RepID=A0A7X2LR31_9BURK|nr:alpha/beta fold hydrolase [Pseudoduganella rivuli]MRV72000.1 alpha/beta fold hydrolase [Pseudoduganella rivuli]